MYYDINKTLSRGRLFNFVVGPRGCGKTYAAKRHVIKRFLTKGKQFVYIRRYETEMPQAEMLNFFSDVIHEFPEHNFVCRNGLFRIDKEIAGWYFPLSKSIMLKSIPFPNVEMIIFDEFIIEVGIYHYLPNEVRTFLECYSTISRDRDVIALFLSNAITMTNPYFLYFNLGLEKNQTVKLTKHISLELVKNDDYIEHVKSTRFGELIQGTDYGLYNMQNEFLLDTDLFIMDMPSGAAYICTFILNNREIGFHISNQLNLWFASDKTDQTCKRRFALIFSEHDQTTILALSRNPFVRQLIESYCNSQLRFTTQEVKNLMTPLLKKLI